MQTTVRVTGLKELNRALSKVNKEAAKEVRDALKKAAEPVAEAARSKKSRFPGASMGTIGPRASQRGVFVQDRARKVSGKRGDFGMKIQTEMLEPALDEHQDEVIEEVEDALDRLGRSAGF